MLDTHTYDGKLDKKIKCNEIFNEFIKKSRNILSINFLKKIIDDIGSNNNYDHTNDLNADDLLSLCSILKHNEDFLNELEIQLLDMQSGFCSQGRTHRLFQLILLFQ